jgi:hypothetical protein
LGYLTYPAFGDSQNDKAEDLAIKQDLSDRLEVLIKRLENEANKSSLSLKDVNKLNKYDLKSLKVIQSLHDSHLFGGAIKDFKTDFDFKTSTIGGLDKEGKSVRDYAEYLRKFQKDIVSLTASEAMGRIRSAYVPPAAIIAFNGNHTLPAEAGGGRLAEFIIPFRGNGTLTADYPSVGVIMYPSGGTECTGTLIAPNIVLTAAHCFIRNKVINNKIEYYCQNIPNIDWIFFPHAGLFKIDKRKILDDWEHNDCQIPIGDLAILKLDRPVSGIKPATFNENNGFLSERATIVGYGVRKYYDNGKELPPDTLIRYSGLKAVANVKLSPCGTDGTLKNALCWKFDSAQDAGSTCEGDSGGPLFAQQSGKWVLAGVTSGGQGSRTSLLCAPGSSAYDVDVRAYAAWIKETIGQYGASSPEGGSVKQLDPLINGSKIFTLFKNWETIEREPWERDIQIGEGVALLRVSINASGDSVMSDLPLKLELENPQQHIRIDCPPSQMESVKTCEVKAPKGGTWHLKVKGRADTNFQIVATSFPLKK